MILSRLRGVGTPSVVLRTGLRRKEMSSAPAVQRTGKLYSKGVGVLGALGQGDSLQDITAFKKILRVDSEEGDEVRSVSAGWGHSAAVTKKGSLLIFGRPFDFSNIMRINRIRSVNKGLGRFVGRFTNWFGTSESDDGLYTTPVIIPELRDVTGVSCSAGLTVCSTGDGSLYSFGLNRWGQCGVDQKDVVRQQAKTDRGTYDKLANNNVMGSHVFLPVKISLPGKAISFDTGLQHCLAVLDNGELYSWGKGNRGQLGDGMNDTATTPQRVSISPKNWSQEISESDLSTLAPAINSGTGTANINNKAQHALQEVKVVACSAGFNHSAALTESGAVYVWGKRMSLDEKEKDLSDETRDNATIAKNNVNQAPLGKPVIYEDQILPRPVTLPNGKKVVQIISSNFSLVMRDEDGGLWAIGVGEYDRVNITKPLVVQRAIEGQLEEDEVAVDAAMLPSDVRDVSVILRKGYNRVIVLSDNQSSNPKNGSNNASNNGSNNGSNGVDGLVNYTNCTHSAFEIVLHGGEAFLQAVLPDDGDSGAEKQELGKQRQLLDMSTGWQHTLAVYSAGGAE